MVLKVVSHGPDEWLRDSPRAGLDYVLPLPRAAHWDQALGLHAALTLPRAQGSSSMATHCPCIGIGPCAILHARSSM